MKHRWALVSVVGLLALGGRVYGQDCPAVIEEPGENLCTDSYPDNFVPHSAFFEATPASCGGPGTTTGIGLATHPLMTVRSPTGVNAGDPITVRLVGWASGSTGTISILASVSADNVTFFPCATSPGRNYLANETPDVFACASPIAAGMLHVRLETTTPSPGSLIFPRILRVEACSSVVGVPADGPLGRGVLVLILAAALALMLRRI